MSNQLPQYVTVDYLAKGLASIKERGQTRLIRARIDGDRHAEAHAQGLLDGAQAMANGIEGYFSSGLGVRESPYVQIVAVAAVVEGICLGMIGFAMWASDARVQLLERIAKYAKEDRAETPGFTRLERALAELERSGAPAAVKP